MTEQLDAVYLERNQVVAALAKCFPSGVKQTAIEGWDPAWHGCVYIDLPTGQASWHFHESQAYLFAGLPIYTGEWDGHDTPEKYRRLAALSGSPQVEAGTVARCIEAIKACRPSNPQSDWTDYARTRDEAFNQAILAVAALRPREQEGGEAPVAWRYEHQIRLPSGEFMWVTAYAEIDPSKAKTIRNVTPLFAHPTPLPAAFDPATSPGMTDMMVAPESLDAFMEANPLPADGWVLVPIEPDDAMIYALYGAAISPHSNEVRVGAYKNALTIAARDFPTPPASTEG